MVRFLSGIFSNWFMIRTMVRRDFKARYVGSFIGVFWSFIHPLMMTALYTLIFAVFFKARVQRLGGGVELPDVNFAVWFLAGLLPWNLFSETLNASANAIRSNSALIKRTLFPSEILPLTSFLLNSITHIIGLMILAVLMLITRTQVTPWLVLLPFYFLLSALFAIGIGWMVAAVNVYLRDIGQVLGIVLQVWFFLTPIFYQPSLIENSMPSLSLYYRLNPFFFIVEGYRGALIGDYSTQPQWSVLYFGYCTVIGAIIFISGAFLYRALKPSFADVL